MLLWMRRLHDIGWKQVVQIMTGISRTFDALLMKLKL